MRANRVSACMFAMAASLAGCTSSGDVAYSGQVRVTSPELIEIDPGVMVVADAEEPLFFSEGNYWLYRDGYWLRSDNYRSGFVRVDLSFVPQRVRTIERPQTYVQYRRHHSRDYSARALERPVRSRPSPAGTYDPPPNQGVPSTPPAETWQPGQPQRPTPTRPMQTPPITAPGDIHGNPMPPHQVPPIDVDRPARPPGAGRPGPQPIPPE